MIHLLVTGGSGYIGGEILALLDGLAIPELQVFVTVRQDQHEVAVKEFPSGLFTPVRLDLSDKEAIKSFISENEIDVVFELTSALRRHRSPVNRSFGLVWCGKVIYFDELTVPTPLLLSFSEPKTTTTYRSAEPNSSQPSEVFTRQKSCQMIIRNSSRD
ncbi:hypothetical protein C366_06255 [Cryptococcus neoformans Tu401-1]|nr:hypothetical protein AYX15_02244 [Cryptococcus neoformans var. grubii]OXG11216.1 hypothetical protein C366_06255 [Cryptococcus neoformans var. grubii Tu401-1]